MTQRDNLFLVAGHPKSGTTFLQRMLNMHPEVSCPAEQQLEAIRHGLGALLDGYQDVLDRFDRNTGGQGAPRIRAGTRARIFRAIVLRLSIDFAGRKPIHGLNENEAFFEIQRYDEPLGRPRILLLFRDPVDIALSAWRHAHRLARTDPKNAEAHLAPLQAARGSLERYVETVVLPYGHRASALLAYAEGRENVIAVRYEALVADTAGALTRLLGFLGADTAEAVIADIVGASSKAAMARASTSPGFFGIGADAEPPVRIAEAFRAELRGQWLTPQMRAIGYGGD